MLAFVIRDWWQDLAKLKALGNMYLAVQVECLLLPGVLARNDLHDIGTSEALLLNLLHRTDLGQGDERAFLHHERKRNFREFSYAADESDG